MGWKMMQWQNVHYMPKCTLLVQRTFIFCASVHFVIASFYYTYSNPLPKCTPLFYKSLLYLAMNLWFYRESMYSKMVHCQNVHFRVGIFFFFGKVTLLPGCNLWTEKLNSSSKRAGYFSSFPLFAISLSDKTDPTKLRKLINNYIYQV